MLWTRNFNIYHIISFWRILQPIEDGGGGGGHWDVRYSGISLFFLRYFGIFLEKLRYYDIGNLAVHGICNSGIKNCGYWPKICLRYYGIEYPPMRPPQDAVQSWIACIFTKSCYGIPIVLFGFLVFFWFFHILLALMKIRAYGSKALQ